MPCINLQTGLHAESAGTIVIPPQRGARRAERREQRQPDEPDPVSTGVGM